MHSHCCRKRGFTQSREPCRHHPPTGALGIGRLCRLHAGCSAALAIVHETPLGDFKVRDGRGYGVYSLVPRPEQWKHGGVTWTINNGEELAAQALRREVEGSVASERARMQGAKRKVVPEP